MSFNNFKIGEIAASQMLLATKKSLVSIFMIHTVYNRFITKEGSGEFVKIIFFKLPFRLIESLNFAQP